LPRPVKAELRGLPKELADRVGGHLWAAGNAVDEYPELALAHAKAARRHAARLPLVREAVAETAYAAGEYTEALAEYRALYRMTGDSAYLPVIADCQRALGKPKEAIDLLKDAQIDDPTQRIEAALVEAGARSDLGHHDEALLVLKQAILGTATDRPGVARLRYAYADLLLTLGEVKGAKEWFASAAAVDDDDELDVDDRLAELEEAELGGVGSIAELGIGVSEEVELGEAEFEGVGSGVALGEEAGLVEAELGEAGSGVVLEVGVNEEAELAEAELAGVDSDVALEVELEEAEHERTDS
jgi:tetratricopeptide (TPR) repeat protein